MFLQLARQDPSDSILYVVRCQGRSIGAFHYVRCFCCQNGKQMVDEDVQTVHGLSSNARVVVDLSQDLEQVVAEILEFFW